MSVESCLNRVVSRGLPVCLRFAGVSEVCRVYPRTGAASLEESRSGGGSSITGSGGGGSGTWRRDTPESPPGSAAETSGETPRPESSVSQRCDVFTVVPHQRCQRRYNTYSLA